VPFDQPTFRAVLLRDDEATPRALTLPSDVDVPPSRIRVPSDFAGASAFDVYELVDDRGWPGEATYRLTSTVPRSIDDLPDHERGLPDHDRDRDRDRDRNGSTDDGLSDPEPQH
jgi:hypothetical protein